MAEHLLDKPDLACPEYKSVAKVWRRTCGEARCWIPGRFAYRLTIACT